MLPVAPHSSRVMISPRWRFAVFVSAIVTALAILEIYYRWGHEAEPRTGHHLYQLDQYTGYSLKPNLVRHSVQAYHQGSLASYGVSTTGEGLRRDGSLELDGDPLVIALMGDSYAFGACVEDNETLAACLEAELNRSNLLHRRCVVLNGGLPGATIVMSLQRYLSRIRSCVPTAIICCLPHQKPYTEALPCYDTPDWLGRDPEFQLKCDYFIDNEGCLGRWPAGNRRISQLCRTSAFAWKLWARNPDESTKEESQQLHQILLHHPEKALQPFVEFERIARKDGALFLTAIRPWQGADSFVPSRHLLTVNGLRDLGLSSIDLDQEMKTSDPELYAIDGHWNRRGHQEAARALFRVLQAHQDALINLYARQHKIPVATLSR